MIFIECDLVKFQKVLFWPTFTMCISITVIFETHFNSLNMHNQEMRLALKYQRMVAIWHIYRTLHASKYLESNTVNNMTLKSLHKHFINDDRNSCLVMKNKRENHKICKKKCCVLKARAFGIGRRLLDQIAIICVSFTAQINFPWSLLTKIKWVRKITGIEIHGA